MILSCQPCSKDQAGICGAGGPKEEHFNGPQEKAGYPDCEPAPPAALEAAPAPRLSQQRQQQQLPVPPLNAEPLKPEQPPGDRQSATTLQGSLSTVLNSMLPLAKEVPDPFVDQLEGLKSNDMIGNKLETYVSGRFQQDERESFASAVPEAISSGEVHNLGSMNVCTSMVHPASGAKVALWRLRDDLENLNLKNFVGTLPDVAASMSSWRRKVVVLQRKKVGIWILSSYIEAKAGKKKKNADPKLRKVGIVVPNCPDGDEKTRKKKSLGSEVRALEPIQVAMMLDGAYEDIARQAHEYETSCGLLRVEPPGMPLKLFPFAIDDCQQDSGKEGKATAVFATETAEERDLWLDIGGDDSSNGKKKKGCSIM